MTGIMISNELDERVHKLSRTGPRKDPCGALNGMCCGQDGELDIIMLWCMSEKYDLNQRITVPEMLKCLWRRCKRKE